jgi:hypothetical protein
MRAPPTTWLEVAILSVWFSALDEPLFCLAHERIRCGWIIFPVAPSLGAADLLLVRSPSPPSSPHGPRRALHGPRRAIPGRSRTLPGRRRARPWPPPSSPLAAAEPSWPPPSPPLAAAEPSWPPPSPPLAAVEPTPGRHRARPWPQSSLPWPAPSHSPAVEPSMTTTVACACNLPMRASNCCCRRCGYCSREREEKRFFFHVQNSGSQKWLASSATFRGMSSTIVLGEYTQNLVIHSHSHPLNQTLGNHFFSSYP